MTISFSTKSMEEAEALMNANKNNLIVQRVKRTLEMAKSEGNWDYGDLYQQIKKDLSI